MPRYRLSRPARLIANGNVEPRQFRPGEIIEISAGAVPPPGAIVVDKRGNDQVEQYRRPVAEGSNLMARPRYLLTANDYLDPSTGRRIRKCQWVETTPDHVPATGWKPLNAEAEAAIARHRRPFTIAANGVQAVDARLGTVRVTRHNEKTPRADAPRSKPQPPAATVGISAATKRPPEAAPSQRPGVEIAITPADFVVERQAVFAGEEDNQLVGASADDVIKLTQPEPKPPAPRAGRMKIG
jgi:hypothetical protein